MTRLLVVDDSALMRRLLVEVFEAHGFEVAVARDGAEALAMLPEVKPDVVTLDIQMPGMDGLACLDRIMLEHPCPVVMFSSLTQEGAEETVEALSLGAVDFAPKPSGAISLKIDEFAPALVEKVREAAGARVRPSRRLVERIRLRSVQARRPLRSRRPPAKPEPRALQPAVEERLVLVGCSTGGPPALDALLEPLPAEFPWPVVVAQHMPASFTGPLAARLDRLCALTVLEVAQPTLVEPGHVYIARGDADVLVSRRRGGLIVMPVPPDPELRWRPSVDRLVDSALQYVPAEQLVGVLMTGMGYDGAAAMTRLHAGGGQTIAEAEETAVVWGMPGELVRAGGAGTVAPLDEIADRLLALAARP